MPQDKPENIVTSADIDTETYSNAPDHVNAAPQHPVYKALQAAIPGKTLCDEELIALFTFARDYMNESGYPLVLSSILKSGGTFQMQGGSIQECCFLVDITNVVHEDRLRAAAKKSDQRRKEKNTSWGSLLGKLGV